MAGDREPLSIGYEFTREEEARKVATDLDRRFTQTELTGLRIYRVRWNGNYLVEAAFSQDVPGSRVENARALLGESGTPVHPDDLEDYKSATEAMPTGSLPEWLKRLFGQGQ